MRLQQHGFTATEAPPLPVGQREHKGKGAVRCIGVQPLVAAAHVAAALGGQGEWCEGETCSSSNQLAAGPVGSCNERAPPSSPSHRHHLPCHCTNTCPPVHQHPSPSPPEPDRRDAAAAQLPLSICNQGILQLVVQVGREEGLGWCAQQGVLPRNIPPVPAESVNTGAQWISQSERKE